MTALLEPRADNMRLSEASRIVRKALKDKSYCSTPLGLEVARYIRWKRTEWGATKDTIRDYESVLARLALFYADLELSDLEVPAGTDKLRECWDHYWGEAAGRTRAKVRSIWVDFFEWAIDEGRGIVGNPARRLKSPKRRGVKRDPYAQSFVVRTITAQDYLADKLGVILVLLYGIRRAELASVRLRDFDFEARELVVVGKGVKVRRIPIVGEGFWRDFGALQLELGGPDASRDLFLLYRTARRGMETFRYHDRAISPHSVGVGWWYRRLAAAGLVTGGRDDGNWNGLGMHRGRHTAASRVLRSTGRLEAAQELLGHSDMSTTKANYAEFLTEDLRLVLASVYEDDEY